MFDPESSLGLVLMFQSREPLFFHHKRQEEKTTHSKILFIHDRNSHNTIIARTVVTFSISSSDQRILTILTKEQRTV